MGGIGDFFKGDEQNVKAKTSPWAPAKPYLKDIMSEAEQIYSGEGPQYYPGDPVADFSPYQTQALDLTADRALAGSPLVDQAGGFYGDLLGGDYMQSGGTGYMTDAMGMFNQANPYFQQLMGAAGGQGPAGEHYASLMSGDMLNSNPYLDEMFSSASRPMIEAWRDQVVPTMSGQFAASGRFGSPAHQRGLEGTQDSLAQGLGDLSANIYGTNYARERGAQDAAAGQLNADAINRLGLGGQFASGLGQTYGADLQRQLGAAGNLSQEQLAALQQMGGAAQGSLGIANQDYMDLAQLYGAGNLQQNQAQNEILGEMARWDFDQIGPGSQQAMLENYLNMIAGAGSGGGHTSQNVYGPSNFENWSNIINSGVSVVGS